MGFAKKNPVGFFGYYPGVWTPIQTNTHPSLFWTLCFWPLASLLPKAYKLSDNNKQGNFVTGVLSTASGVQDKNWTSINFPPFSTFKQSFNFRSTVLTYLLPEILQIISEKPSGLMRNTAITILMWDGVPNANEQGSFITMVLSAASAASNTCIKSRVTSTKQEPH